MKGGLKLTASAPSAAWKPVEANTEYWSLDLTMRSGQTEACNESKGSTDGEQGRSSNHS